MSQIKNPQKFTELEYCIQRYFDGKISSVMKSVKDDLNHKQAKEMADYLRSPAGILASANPFGVDTSLSTLKYTGEWNSKTTEDYIQMCNTQIQKSASIQKDLGVLAEEWRKAVVEQIGRKRYDELSQNLGCDLAYSYIGSRMEDLMISKLVSDNMPKSSAGYIIRKAAKSSLWGLSNELMKSPLTHEIEEKGEKAYKPKGWEKTAGTLVGSTVDALSTGGAGSWKSLVTFLGVDMALGYVIEKAQGNAQQKKEQVMEVCISKGVFQQNTNAFTGFRNASRKIDAFNNEHIQSINKKLNSKMYIPDPKFSFTTYTNNNQFQFSLPTIQSTRNNPKYKDVPLIVAPGKEEEYLKAKAQYETAKKEEQKKAQAQAEAKAKAESEVKEEKQEEQEQRQEEKQEEQEQTTRTNTGGWLDMLANATGMDGFGNVLGNLGYTLAMLPDVLVGMFTGRTQSLNMKNTMMPLAAILAGLFIKNPILKTLLITLGGANLLNKAGKEALGWKQAENGTGVQNANVQYKPYADEILNPRIANPVLKGNCLVATIDNVPCTIQLTQNVVGAYQAGALPLNTLANAVLAKNDQMQQLAQHNYGERETETIVRTRGIQ